MKRTLLPYFFCVVCLCCTVNIYGQQHLASSIENNFRNPPPSARPWVFWYWMHGAVSKQGITADLEAMKEVGIGGAYLMPIQDTVSSIPFHPTERQLTPGWWKLVKFAMQEARRLGLQLAMHVSDGFALAGGPWITPELSMQKLVWTKEYVKGGDEQKIKLSQPETRENYYKDIAVFAYPANCTNAFSDTTLIPIVTTSNGARVNFLAFPGEDKESFKSDTTCWIQYKYPQPFTCRSIQIHTGGNNYQAERLIVQSSNDGIHFNPVTRLKPPRHGWQDADEDITCAIPSTTATYFRFVYNKEGSEPGAEDLDAAKWKPSLKVNGIYLSDEPVINQYESKNGSVWRVSESTTEEQVPLNSAVPLTSIINLTGKMDTDGNLNWLPPPGKWIIVRIGHTSTAHTNATGGGGKGLECDKFNPAAIKIQFDNWFAKAFEIDTVLAREVLKIFHVDSWECGSQNWSETFPAEFKKRRGYEIGYYLLAMTGVPVENAANSEKFLHDVRETIAELVNDVFYVTLNKLAHEKGCSFSAESVAPTMVSDGLLHYKTVDLPMGEFWLNSPTHDKPNDMHDAISGAHIYGKNIIQAEAFTTLRMDWSEYPGKLKTLGDRNFALGINRIVLHVFTHNPWMDKKPGMTLDGVGLYFQRDQTWFKLGKAWIEYLARCSALLQTGKPITDIAVFTGEEVPRRSILPDRLINTLPGIFGKAKLEKEKKRLANIGQPLRTIPDGVTHSANMADPEDWIDPLNGYSYDSFNPDALMQMQVKNGRVVLPEGASYRVLIFPGKHPMQPNDKTISLASAKKILQLVKDGAIIIMNDDYRQGIGLKDEDDSIKVIMKELFKPGNKKGKVIPAPCTDSSFASYGLKKDLVTSRSDIAWTHRKATDGDIYFVSNQEDNSKKVKLSFGITGMVPEEWDPVTGHIFEARWEIKKGRTMVEELLYPGQSLFIIFRKRTNNTSSFRARIAPVEYIQPFSGKWLIQFDNSYGGPGSPLIVDDLKSWTRLADSSVKYYSGTAVYTNSFFLNKNDAKKSAWLEFDSIYNIATVRVNGTDCGTLWTRPFLLDISKAARQGENKIEIEVANTWHNRLIGDNLLPPAKRITWTTAPFRLKDKPLLPAGLVGKLKLIIR